VLDDGTSAIYGSDAVAGVVNIITRKDFDGAETSFRYGGSTEGGAVEYTASQLLGHFWDSGDFVLNYEYDDQGGLDASQRNWIGAPGRPLFSYSGKTGETVSLQRVARISAVKRRCPRTFSTAIETLKATAFSMFPARWRVSPPPATRRSRRPPSVSTGICFGDWHANITGNYSNTRQLVNTGTFAFTGLPSQ